MTVDPLGNLIEWAAPLGLAGLFGVAVAERLVPVLPSYGLLVAIGIGAAGGLWPAPLAVVAVTFGSVLGCLAAYGIAMALGRAGATSMLRWSARLLGLPPARLDGWIEGYCRNQELISFGAQFVPTIRLLAPVIAGLLGAGLRGFLLATGAGVAAWSALFIGLGYAVALLSPEVNASALALQILAALLLAEGLVLLAWRRFRRRRSSAAFFRASRDSAPGELGAALPASRQRRARSRPAGEEWPSARPFPRADQGKAGTPLLSDRSGRWAGG